MHLGGGSLKPVDLLVEPQLLLVFDVLDEERLVDDSDPDPGAVIPRDGARNPWPGFLPRSMTRATSKPSGSRVGQIVRLSKSA